MRDTKHIIQICCLNGALGQAIGLHDSDHIEEIFRQVRFPATTGAPETGEEYLRCLQDACHGPSTYNPADGSNRRFGSPALFKSVVNPSCLDALRGEFISTIVDWNCIQSIMPDAFKSLFSLNTSNPPGPYDPIWSMLGSLDSRIRSARHFRPNLSSWWIKKPVHWWTLREKIEAILSSRRHDTWADDLRDALGLYYPEYAGRADPEHWKKNIRFVLHVPVEVVVPFVHSRPNFAEAAGYCRFAVHRDMVAPAALDDWGRTADLGIMASSGKLADGFHERVSTSLDRADFSVLPIHFDFLGAVTCSRGSSPVDGDEAFKKELEALYGALAAHDASALDLAESFIPAVVR